MSSFSLKDITASKDSFYYVPLESIKIKNGFNARKDFGDIQGLAMDIATNGLAQPLIVRLAPEERCVYLDDGERRFQAINYINANGLLEGGIHDVKCILENRGTNEEARILKMFSTGVNSKPLTDEEQAGCLYRLFHDYHMTPKDIGKRIGRSVSYVHSLLSLRDGGLPAMISSGSIKEKIERIRGAGELSEYGEHLIMGLELALGLWELEG